MPTPARRNAEPAKTKTIRTSISVVPGLKPGQVGEVEASFADMLIEANAAVEVNTLDKRLSEPSFETARQFMHRDPKPEKKTEPKVETPKPVEDYDPWR